MRRQGRQQRLPIERLQQVVEGAEPVAQILLVDDREQDRPGCRGSAGSDFSSCRTCQPSLCGIRMSRTIAAGLISRALRRPSSPPAARRRPGSLPRARFSRRSSIMFGIVVDREDQRLTAVASIAAWSRSPWPAPAGDERRASWPARSAACRRGRVSVKVEPAPSLLSTRDVAAQQAGEMATDRQAQAGAAVLARAAAVDLAELLEDQLRACSGMPMPVSATASASRSPCRRARHRDPARPR